MAKSENKKQQDALEKKSSPGFQSGTVEVDGEQFEVVGRATYPTIKIADGQSKVLRLDAEIFTEPKMAKDGSPAMNEEGKPSMISTMVVTDVGTGEVGKIVVGAIPLRALNKYPGGYVGKFFLFKKHAKLEGQKAKDWTITEVSPKAK